MTGLSDAIAIAASDNATCAVHATGALSCWGENVRSGAPANGMFTMDTAPTVIDGITDVTGIAISDDIFCAARVSGTTSCWANRQRLATGGTRSSPTRIDLPSLSDTRSFGTSAWGHACLARLDGHAACWGGNNYGQLGIGAADDMPRNSETPQPLEVVGLTDVVSVSAGTFFACALHAAGTVSCWGRGAGGALGNGAEADAAAPVAVSGITDATEISGSGGGSTCVAHADGSVSCWGAMGPTRTSTPVTIPGVRVPTGANYPVDSAPGTTGAMVAGAAARATAERRAVLPGGGSTGDTGSRLDADVSVSARAAATSPRRVALHAGYVGASGLAIRHARGRACPAAATLRITAGKRSYAARLVTTVSRRHASTCTVSAVVALPPSLAKARRATATFSGKGVKRRSFIMRRG